MQNFHRHLLSSPYPCRRREDLEKRSLPDVLRGNTHRCSTGPQAKLDHGLTAPSETDLCAGGRTMLAGFMNHMCALRAHGNLTQPTRSARTTRALEDTPCS